MYVPLSLAFSFAMCIDAVFRMTHLIDLVGETTFSVIELIVGIVIFASTVYYWRRNDRHIENKVHKELRLLCQCKDHSWMKFGGFANEDERYKDIAFSEKEEDRLMSEGYYATYTLRHCHFCSYSVERFNRMHTPNDSSLNI